MRTRMTDGMDLPAGLTARPDEVTTVAIKAVRQYRDVVYVLRIQCFTSLVFRVILECLFERMKV